MQQAYCLIKDNPAQIVSVSGRKSVSSLSIYQHVGSTGKISMRTAIGNNLDGAKTTKQNTYHLLLEEMDLKVTLTQTNYRRNLQHRLRLDNLTFFRSMQGTRTSSLIIILLKIKLLNNCCQITYLAYTKEIKSFH